MRDMNVYLYDSTQDCCEPTVFDTDKTLDKKSITSRG
jgi:hypothetical protein